MPDLIARTGMEIIQYLASLKDETKTYDLKVHREKRSLTANSYYHVLLRKLAGVLGSTEDELHEVILRRYGQYQYDRDGRIMLVTLKSGEAVPEGWHLVGYKTSSDGKFTSYRVIRGSSTYDSKDFSILLDGLISECKEVDIETLPPHEIERMKQRMREEENGKEITQHHH